VHQLLGSLDGTDVEATLLTPYSWMKPLTYPVFAARLAIERVSHSGSVIWYRRGHEVFLYRALRRKLATLDNCVVYAQGPVEARAALRARKGPNQRVIMAVHFKTSQADEWCNTETFPIKRGGWVYRGIRKAERKTILQLDGLLYVAAWAKEALESWLPEASQVPSAVIGNFTAPLDPEPTPGPLADLVSTGGLDSVKNHTFLLDVLAEARKAGRQLTLDVYGEGVLRGDLEAKTRELGLQDQVRWRGFRRDVRQQLPGYRVYVHPSYSEVAPLAIIEAMAAGLPVVAGRVGGIPEIFDDGKEGRYWPVDDPVQATAVLLALIDDEPARLAAGEAARARFHRDFAADAVVSKLVAFLYGRKPADVLVDDRVSPHA
jgi:glycosyltransferase involved in cell wall biosynthesis